MEVLIKKIEKKYGIKIIETKKPNNFDNAYSKGKNGNVVILRLSEILLNDIDFLLPLGKHLKELVLNDCEITNIEMIGNFKNLKKLDLSINPISNLKGLKEVSSLLELRLMGTEISSTSKFKELQNLQKLKFLDLEGTNINSINGLENLKNLRKLNLSDTDIISFDDIEEMQNVNHLIFNSCVIDFNKLSIEKIINLEKLDLFCCVINSFTGLNKLKNLKQLCLNNATIKKKEGLNGLKQLQVLDLSETELTKIEGLEDLSNLVMLNLSKNKISNTKGLENLKNLEFVDLRNNKLTNINIDNFIGIEKECIVDIGFNDISYEIKTLENISFVYNQEGKGLNLEGLTFKFGKIKNVEEYCRSIKKKYLNRIKKFGLGSSLSIKDFNKRALTF